MIKALVLSLHLILSPDFYYPEKELVDINVQYDRIEIVSKMRIDHIEIFNSDEWADYFICYSPDAKKVKVLIRSKKPRLNFHIELFDDYGFRRKVEKTITNPYQFRN